MVFWTTGLPKMKAFVDQSNFEKLLILFPILPSLLAFFDLFSLFRQGVLYSHNFAQDFGSLVMLSTILFGFFLYIKTKNIYAYILSSVWIMHGCLHVGFVKSFIPGPSFFDLHYWPYYSVMVLIYLLILPMYLFYKKFKNRKSSAQEGRG
jgi:hypothetical protein